MKQLKQTALFLRQEAFLYVVKKERSISKLINQKRRKHEKESSFNRQHALSGNIF